MCLCYLYFLMGDQNKMWENKSVILYHSDANLTFYYCWSRMLLLSFVLNWVDFYFLLLPMMKADQNWCDVTLVETWRMHPLTLERLPKLH